MEDLKEIIKNQFTIIPKDVRDFILSSELRTMTDPVGNQYGLNDDQKISLRDEVLFVLLGLELLSDFVKNIETEVGTPREKAEGIAIEVHKNIFSKVIDSLREIEQTLKYVDSETEAKENQKNGNNENILQKQGATPLRPDHMLPDHEQLERSEGPHLHSQTIMPQGGGNEGGTIIDDKLSKMVRFPREEVRITDNKSEGVGYKESDPYREPTN